MAYTKLPQVVATALGSATGTVDTSSSAAPTPGQNLTAVDATHAQWTDPVASGTVTSVAVTTANGVSGSVATPTTTPHISLTLGAITPSSVAAAGTVTGSNLSGNNTGDQTITLTGGVTGSGVGSFVATVITNANLTGPITSVGNVTSLASQTGTGSKIVVDTSPTLITPNIGVATATSVNSTTIPTNKTLVVTTDKLNVLQAVTSSEFASLISDETGTGSVVFSNSPILVTPALGTPSALVGTNITGTATSFTASNVTTNANLTGPITSVGNATSIASQTGTGTKFVVDTSPILVTPNIGAATATSLTVALVQKTANYSITSSDFVILADASAGAIAMTLPTASGVSGRMYCIKKHVSTINSVTIATTGGQTIDGGATAILAYPQAVWVVSNGSNWFII